jgi:hypothetical protein
LRKLRRESPTEAYVFVTERGGPMTISSRGSARPPGCLSHCILTCCGMRAAISLPTTGTIPEPCSTISATRTSSTPSVTPSFHPTGSATSGEISVDVAGRRVGSVAGSPCHFSRTFALSSSGWPPAEKSSSAIEIIHASATYQEDLQVSPKACLRSARPPGGGTFLLEISVMPPLPKTCPKMVSAP